MGTFSTALRALLAALTMAGVPPAPELCMIPRGGVVLFIVGIKVIFWRPIGDIPAITVLYHSVDIKYLIILLELVHQGRYRLEEQRESSPHSGDHSHCWRTVLGGYASPRPQSQCSPNTKAWRKFILCGTEWSCTVFCKMCTSLATCLEKSCPWRPLVLQVVVSRLKGPG